MKFKHNGMTALATGVVFAAASLAARADGPVSGGLTQLTTAGGTGAARFAAGATINGGVSYLDEVPASEPADLVFTIDPDPADVGKEAAILAVLRIPGLGGGGGVGWFQRISGGIWVPWDSSNLLALRPYTTKTLQEHETITLIDGLVGEDANMAGMTIDAYVGYAVNGDFTKVTFNTLGPSQTDADGAPAQLAIAESAGESCPANTTAGPVGEQFKGKDVCVLSGRITSDTHLTANFSYYLADQVIIGENDITANAEKIKLTIDAGTTVFAPDAGGGLGYLVIDRGGQLHANGTREKPVIFTYESDEEATEVTTGRWGGLVLNGSATLNVGGGTADGEGGSGTYGGGDNPNDEDSSGVMTFVQVKYAGQAFTEEDELNGIAFQGTGSGTLVDYVQVHNNSDDGVEFFGGTTNAKHILLTGNEDDALDWTQGWKGKAQFVAIRQTTASQHCIEADSNSDDNDAKPRANPEISNVTCNGSPGAGTEGIMLREGTNARLSNVVMGNLSAYCIDIDDEATFRSALSEGGTGVADLNGMLTMTNSRVHESCPLQDESGDLFSVSDWFGAQQGSKKEGVDLGGGNNLINGHRLNSVAPVIPDDPFFEKVDHIGAIKDETSDWTAGWSFSDWD